MGNCCGKRKTRSKKKRLSKVIRELNHPPRHSSLFSSPSPKISGDIETFQREIGRIKVAEKKNFWQIDDNCIIPPTSTFEKDKTFRDDDFEETNKNGS